MREKEQSLERERVYLNDREVITSKNLLNQFSPDIFGADKKDSIILRNQGRSIDKEIERLQKSLS